MKCSHSSVFMVKIDISIKLSNTFPSTVLFLCLSDSREPPLDLAISP